MTDTTTEDQPREAVLYTIAPPTSTDRQPLSKYQLERLHADLHRARVATRDQGGRTLSYLEAYDVKATLIRIFGYGNFSVDVLEARITHESTYRPENGNRDLWRIAAMATVRLTIHQTGATYTESAAASQSGPDIGEVMDFAIKTAESDALKRCAIYLGSTFGLSLYDNGTTQDVVRVVYAPDQKDLVDELNDRRAAMSDNPEVAGAAVQRLQARFKTQPPAAQEPQEPAEAPVEPPADPQAPKTPRKRPAAAQVAS